MKYIITESQLQSAAVKWLNTDFGDLKPLELPKYPGQIFYMKEGRKRPIFEFRVDNNIVLFSKDEIWDHLGFYFGLTWSETRRALKQWVGETYGLTVLYGIGAY
jgi:hypothetical protein